MSRKRFKIIVLLILVLYLSKVDLYWFCILFNGIDEIINSKKYYEYVIFKYIFTLLNITFNITAVGVFHRL